MSDAKLPPFTVAVAAAMARRGMTAKALAESSGETQSTISRILSGEMEWPRLNTCLTICRALKIPSGRLGRLLKS